MYRHSIEIDSRSVLLEVGDLLGASTDVIVNPANSNLSHGAGVAGQIVSRGGESIQKESYDLIEAHGPVTVGSAVYTSAGRMPFKAIIHAVAPMHGDAQEQDLIRQAVLSSLELCETNGWHSIAFPAIGTGIFRVPPETCAAGFVEAISSHWLVQHKPEPSQIVIYLGEPHFGAFRTAFGALAGAENSAPLDTDEEEHVGYVDLSDETSRDLDGDDEIDDWFN